MSFFRNLTPQTCHEIFTQLEQVIYQPGEIIIKANDVAEYFYIIEQGTIDVYKSHEITEENKVNTRRAGDAFGENALRTGVKSPRIATVVAR